MKRADSLAAALLLLACSEARGPVASTPEVGAGAMQGSAACGADGEPCCPPPLPECGLGFACEPDTGACAPTPSPPTASSASSSELCRSSSDCAVGYTCCPAGVLGSCEALAPADCPLPDLVLVRSAGNGPSLVSFDTATVPCAAELGCATAEGTRTSLGFLPDLLNVGTADLLIGDPRAANGLPRLDCMAQLHPIYTFVELFRYALLDPSGVEVAHGSQSVTLECEEQVGYRFRSDFCGIQRAQGAASLNDLPYEPSDCGGIDVTDVSPGAYTLRVTVNADRIWPESDYANNSLNLPLVLPSADPTQPCADPVFDQLGGGDCGWQPVFDATCQRGEAVAVGCAGCERTGEFRVCEGAAACREEQAVELDQSGCSVAFTCPDSGAYAVMTKAADADSFSVEPAAATSCQPQRIEFDPLAACSPPLLGVGATRECGWTPALSAECAPGQEISLACLDCDRKPMLRVCDGAGACSHLTELASFEDPPSFSDHQSENFGECPELSFTCPDSGQYMALLASYWENEPYGCELEVAVEEEVEARRAPPSAAQ